MSPPCRNALELIMNGKSRVSYVLYKELEDIQDIWLLRMFHLCVSLVVTGIRVQVANSQ